MHSLAMAGGPAPRGAGMDPVAPGPGSWDPVLEVDVQALVPRLGALPDEMNPILRLVDGRRTAAEIVREGAGRDPGAPGRVEALRRQGILRVVGSGEGAGCLPPAEAPAAPTEWFVPPTGAPRTAARGGARWARLAFPLVALGLVGLAVAAAITLSRRDPVAPAPPARAGAAPAPSPADAPAAPVLPGSSHPEPALPPRFGEAGPARAGEAGAPRPAAEAPLPESSPSLPEPSPALPPAKVRRSPAAATSATSPPAPRATPRQAAPRSTAPHPAVARPTAAEAAATYRQALADGQGNMERGAHLAAVADYRRALSARSTGEAWFGLGQALAEAGRPDEARQAFRRSLEAEPQGPHAGEAVRAMLRLR